MVFKSSVVSKKEKRKKKSTKQHLDIVGYTQKAEDSINWNSVIKIFAKKCEIMKIHLKISDFALLNLTTFCYAEKLP